MIDFVRYTYPSTKIKCFRGHRCVEYWVSEIEVLFHLQRLFYAKQISTEVCDIPFHKLVLKCIDFKIQMSLVFNILARHGVRFTVVSSDGDVMLHSAVNFLRVRDIFEDCNFTVHISSVELVDCRPNYEHEFPELNIDDSEPDDSTTSDEFLDSTSDENVDENYVPIGCLFYVSEQ